MAQQHKSVVKDLFTLQSGIGKKSIHRMRGHIMKKLLCSSKRTYFQVRKFHMSGPSMFTLLHRGRILLHENKENVQCYSSYERKPHKLYNFPYESQCKDLIVWSPDSPLSTNILLEQQEKHTASLLYLTSTRRDQYLARRCVLTGQMCDYVYLSLSAKLKFSEIQCDPETDTIVLKSTKNTKDVNNYITLAIFSSPPLRFIAMFDINREVFGKKIIDAGVQQGLLFVRYSDDKMKFYSLEYILSKYSVWHYKIGEVLEDGGVVGQPPFGLPITLHILEEPPVLMNVNSKQGDLTIGGNPWHYITKPNYHNAEIRNLESRDFVTTLHMPGTDTESEHVFFHPDESNRIIHLTSTVLKISWIQNNSLDTWLQYTAGELQDQKPVVTQPRVSRYGRSLRPSSSLQNSIALGDYDLQTQELSIFYDDESNLIGVLEVIEGRHDDEITIDKVVLFDNENGKLVRIINLQKFRVKAPLDTSNFSLSIEGIQFLIIVKHKDQTFGLLGSLNESELDF